MKLSVAILTYNLENYIRECLDSVLGQEVGCPYEIIIGDDCSTDRTRIILEEYYQQYPEIIRLHYRPLNGGVQANLRETLALCRGEYIAYIDGDDRMLPGKLQKQMDYLDKHPECALVCHDMAIFDTLTGEIKGYYNDSFKKPAFTVEDLVRFGLIFAHSSKMYRKAATPVEGVDMTTKYINEWLFHIQNATHGSIGFINEVLGEYRLHPKNYSKQNAARPTLVLRDQLYTLQKAREYGVKPDIITAGLSRIYYSHAISYLERRDYAAFAKSIKLSAADQVFYNRKHYLFYKLRWAPMLLHALNRALDVIRS